MVVHNENVQNTANKHETSSSKDADAEFIFHQETFEFC
jgi:hypothetical protein